MKTFVFLSIMVPLFTCFMYMIFLEIDNEDKKNEKEKTKLDNTKVKDKEKFEDKI